VRVDQPALAETLLYLFEDRLVDGVVAIESAAEIVDELFHPGRRTPVAAARR